MQWCYLRCCNFHVMLALVPMLSHDQKCHFVCHFDHLGQADAMLPLIMPLVSFDADTGAYNITRPKSHVACHFDISGLRNAVVAFTMPLAS